MKSKEIQKKRGKQMENRTTSLVQQSMTEYRKLLSATKIFIRGISWKIASEILRKCPAAQCWQEAPQYDAAASSWACVSDLMSRSTPVT
jgi:hypothetical protein